MYKDIHDISIKTVIINIGQKSCCNKRSMLIDADMSKWYKMAITCGMKLLIHSLLDRWSWGMDK